ncbi:MAG TPA: YbhB/YbcL family Raf kinase inhibitor-like protein [Anaerolineales bacterium]|nr:YbhB/YbcL family Raf kinase inhibitor-like protein [Anaerolineales bacterium]
MKRLPFLLLLVFMLLSACAPTEQETPQQTITDPLGMEEAVSIEITSSAFANGQPIPPKHACTGDAATSLKDVSPALSWSEPPAGTQSFALIMNDPDAPVGTWDHWILFNIPASTRSLPESMPVNSGFSNGSNSWGRTGYGGPCPPSGTHRYFFKLYALDEMLAISEGASKGELEKAMVGHILAQGELMGTFAK